jgi:hypothetical protein
MWDGDLRIASEQSERTRAKLLAAFVQELSFWGEVPEKFNLVSTTSLSSLSEASIRNGNPVWRTAVDPTSGRTYYYDAISRKTQWEKVRWPEFSGFVFENPLSHLLCDGSCLQPAEIRDLERKKKDEKKKLDRIFFQEMEQNIYRSLARGELIPGIPTVQRDKVDLDTTTKVIQKHPEQTIPYAPRARTISGMDDVLLQQLSTGNSCAQRNPVTPKTRRDAHGRPPLPGRHVIEHRNSLEFSPEETRSEKNSESDHPLLMREESELGAELRGVALLDGPILEEQVNKDDGIDISRQNPQQSHVRRNTGGTVFVKSTMMNPDVEATIKVSAQTWIGSCRKNTKVSLSTFKQCICGVYRAHIVQAVSKRSHSSPVSVACSKFSDVFLDDDYIGSDLPLPSLDDVVEFYHDFYVRSQMEHDTIIMSLIYVERLIKETTIAPLSENWRSVLFSCMVLASKVWDDLSMWNIDFSNVCGRCSGLAQYTLPRINQLELALLKALSFNVKVPASEYAKYYFLIRSMLMKSGLLVEVENSSQPSESGHAKIATITSPQGHRGTRSLHDYSCFDQQLLSKDSQRGSFVCLEQLLSQTTY